MYGTLAGTWYLAPGSNSSAARATGGTIPWWAVLFSIVATETSALTFISIPGLAYLGAEVYAAADVDESGVDDLIVSAPQGGSAGLIYLFLDPAPGHRTALTADAVLFGTAPDYAGWAMAGDGEHLLVGLPGDDAREDAAGAAVLITLSELRAALED